MELRARAKRVRWLVASLVVSLAAGAAAWAVVCSSRLFPYLSDNKDEAAYLLQADVLRSGHLFAGAPGPAPSSAFLPWLWSIRGDHYVPKYTPVHPAFIALSRAVFGTDRAALALIAAGAVMACYFLAREVLGSRTEAVLAAGFMAASPLVLIQSATFLSYLSTVVLLMAFGAALLAGVRRGSGGLLALSGFLLGVAAFARAFDTVLFAVPFGAWWLFGRTRRPSRRRVREAGWLAAGLALPCAAMLAYFRAATGSPWQLPFTLTDPTDTIGFGARRMFPGQPATIYTPHLALTGLVRLGTLSSVWVFGGLLLFGFAIAGWRAGRRRRRELGSAATYLGLVLVTVPLGYTFFWGSYGSTQWGGPWRFGPFYWLPIIVPLSILGAGGFARLYRSDRWLAAGSALAMTAMSAVLVVMAVGAHRPFTQQERHLYAGAMEAATLQRAVVFVPPLQGPWLLQPFEMARNAGYDGRVVWAIDNGPVSDLAVLSRFPGRTPYLVVAPDVHSTATLERLALDVDSLTIRTGRPGRTAQ